MPTIRYQVFLLAVNPLTQEQIPFAVLIEEQDGTVTLIPSQEVYNVRRMGSQGACVAAQMALVDLAKVNSRPGWPPAMPGVWAIPDKELAVPEGTEDLVSYVQMEVLREPAATKVVPPSSDDQVIYGGVIAKSMVESGLPKKFAAVLLER